MASYTLQQRIVIIELFYENGCSVRNVFRKLRDVYGRHNRPTEQQIVRKFQETGAVQDRERRQYARAGRSEENIGAVSDSVAADPNTSISRRSQQLGLSESTVWRILHKDLALKAYKVQLTQELLPQDHGMRRDFANWILEQNDDLKKKSSFRTKHISRSVATLINKTAVFGERKTLA